MTKQNNENYKRSKGKDKQKNTFNKYGKYTKKGLRHLEYIKNKLESK
jgi:hypothetical protein|tara:strand:+ start:335 stop:475 length:141 start_codon:yes stop_codon:yes gene_type:complete